MKKSEFLKINLTKKPKCTECNGSGKIRVGCHWYTTGWEKTCTYCKGTGKLYWAKDVTKEDLIRSAKQKLTVEEQQAVGIL